MRLAVSIETKMNSHDRRELSVSLKLKSNEIGRYKLPAPKVSREKYAKSRELEALKFNENIEKQKQSIL